MPLNRFIDIAEPGWRYKCTPGVQYIGSFLLKRYSCSSFVAYSSWFYFWSHCNQSWGQFSSSSVFLLWLVETIFMGTKFYLENFGLCPMQILKFNKLSKHLDNYLCHKISPKYDPKKKDKPKKISSKCPLEWYCCFFPTMFMLWNCWRWETYLAIGYQHLQFLGHLCATLVTCLRYLTLNLFITAKLPEIW